MTEGFTLSSESSEDKFFEKPQGCFRVKQEKQKINETIKNYYLTTNRKFIHH